MRMRQFTSQEAYWDFCRENQDKLDAALARGEQGPLIDPTDKVLSSTDEELLQRYTRTQNGNLEAIVRIEWNGHSPEPIWQPVPGPAGRVLGDPAIFRSCIWCGRRTHVGHLGQHDVCHGCQENYFGIRH